MPHEGVIGYGHYTQDLTEEKECVLRSTVGISKSAPVSISLFVL